MGPFHQVVDLRFDNRAVAGVQMIDFGQAKIYTDDGVPFGSETGRRYRTYVAQTEDADALAQLDPIVRIRYRVARIKAIAEHPELRRDNALFLPTL